MPAACFGSLEKQFNAILASPEELMKSFTSLEIINTLNRILDIEQRISGMDYLKRLVGNIAQTFEAKYVFVGHAVKPENDYVQTDVVWAGNDYSDNFTYRLKDTPCENVFSGKRVCIYPNRVAGKFPKDELLVEMGVESYIGSPMLTSEGELSGLLVLLDDKPIEGVDFFTAIVDFLASRVAAELEKYYIEDKLKQQVEEKTKEIERANLELKAVNRELEAFAYSVTHDLRAPLRHIDGFIELLQNRAGKVLDQQNRHYMGNISEAARKMDRLIDALLTFSRMGRHDISFQQVDLDNLVRDIIGELDPDTTGREIEWCLGNLPAVEGDPAMLRIVMVNLIGNALKFTRPRQQARIEIGSLPGQNSDAVIFVRDNGVGFDMAYMDKLFGVFQRLHRSDQFEGTGIGLANVRRIIARHGGSTWATGDLNQGATFFFSLPETFHEWTSGDIDNVN
jgi:signal transduction histidine kinase